MVSALFKGTKRCEANREFGASGGRTPQLYRSSDVTIEDLMTPANGIHLHTAQIKAAQTTARGIEMAMVPCLDLSSVVGIN
jgi:hypothetical protein